MDQDRKSAVSKLETLKEQNKGLPKDVKSKLTALINILKDGVPRNMDIEPYFKALENALNAKNPVIWKQIKEIRNSLATDSTGNVGDETFAAAPSEQNTRAQCDTEMGFMVESFRAIIEILETNRDTEPFPKPSERQKEAVGECYKYALKVASLCKEQKRETTQLQVENKYLKLILDDLHKSIIVGEATLHMELKPPEDIKNDKLLIELTTNTRKIHLKFYDLETELDYIQKRISQLTSMIVGDDRSKDPTQEKINKFTATGRQPKRNTAKTIEQREQSSKLDQDIELVTSVWRNFKEKESDLERVSKIIEDLHNQAKEINVAQAQEKQETPTITGFKKGGVDMGNTVPKSTVPDMTPKLDKRSNDVSSPSTKRINTTSSYKKETQETKQRVPTETEPDNRKELEMKAAAVFEALKKITDTKRDLERVSKIIEDLHNQAEEINVDQAQEKQETLTTTGFKQGGVDMGATAPKRTVSGMTQKQEKSASDVSSPSKKTIDKTSGPRKGTQETEQTVPTTIEPDIRKELEMKAAEVSEALKKFKDTKREAEYAACLLEELSSFSHATNKDDNVNVLSRPQNVETSQDFKEKDAKNVDNPRQKPRQCVCDENLEKYYKYASHVLRDMKESERLRNDLEIEKRQIRDLKTRLKSIQDENTKLNKEADSLRSRLSEHAGALLYHENPAIADLSDQNRPTKLAEKYLELYDNQWTDAFSKLQTEYSSASDEELTGHLYNILVDGYVFCKDARQAQIINLQEIMFNPTDDVSKNRRRPTEEVSKMFSNCLSDASKLSSKVTSGNIAKAFVKNEETKQKHGQMIKLCNTYIHECLQLCWYMQVQTPPLCLDLNTAKGHAFEKNSYKEYTIGGKKIAFVVWPALFLHEKGPLLSKGVAQGDSTGKQAAED